MFIYIRVEDNEEVHAYATFIGEPTAYVLNALIEKPVGCNLIVGFLLVS